MGPSLRTAGKREDPPNQVKQKHLCQQAGQPIEESFRVGMTEEENANPPSSKEAMDQVGNQRESTKTGLKGANL